MLTQNKDIGLTLPPLFLAFPLRQRYFNWSFSLENDHTSINSFISQYLPRKHLFTWRDAISAFSRRLLFLTFRGLSSAREDVHYNSIITSQVGWTKAKHYPPFFR